MKSRQTIAMMCESDALGGAEMVILRLATALNARGYRVVGIGPDVQTQPDRGSNGWLRRKFADAGFEWGTYRKRWPVDPQCARQLATLLRELRADVAHSHEFGMAVYGTAAARRAGLPHVISMHGNMAMTERWTRRVALRWAFARSRATIAVSDGTRAHLEETLGARLTRLRVIRNGVPVPAGDREQGRAAIGARDDETVVLAVGSLTPRKAHLLLLQALLAMGTGAGSRWKVAIAGTGPERKRLEEFVSAQGLESRVKLLGARDDVADLLAACDVFAMPSLWEGLPLALLEAMHAGKAIVATDVAGVPEAIRNGVHGLLIPPSDVAALASALRRLLDDAALRQELGDAARERARADFSIDAMTEAYLRCYFGES